jgi:two-component system alkaline phosphatase synthesis response regulator PhoP
MARVLVIDDEPDVVWLCKLNLEHAGHEVIGALDGERGLALAREHRPDAVVIDLILPAMDGYEVLRIQELERAASDVPLLVLTAKVRREDRIRCLRIGADAFLTKPFAPHELVETLTELLRTGPDERAARRALASAAR